MAIAIGLDGAIVNPLDRKMMANIITAAARTRIGRDVLISCADSLAQLLAAGASFDLEVSCPGLAAIMRKAQNRSRLNL
ncbi:MAG: hypothetical protein WBM78_20060 [Desulfobacterales bacterium]